MTTAVLLRHSKEYPLQQPDRELEVDVFTIIDETPPVRVNYGELVAPSLQKQREFENLVREWELDQPRGVNISKMVMHEAYQRIIGMGADAVPLLLRELEREPDHWFWALYAITGANPVPLEDEGNLEKMAEAWVNWGKEHGYHW